MTNKSVIHVFSFRMTDNERDENSVNDGTDSDNDQELLVEASRDTSHATTNLETLMHLFKVNILSSKQVCVFSGFRHIRVRKLV